MNIRILGITGPSGAGKSLLSQSLSAKGIPVIDADQVYHSLLIPPSPCLDALRDAFGDGIFGKDGALDRSALSAIVFHDKEKLNLLNKTVLRFVLERIDERIKDLDAKGHTVVAVDAPTLIESGYHKQCHTVVSVLAKENIREERICKRDHLTEEQAKARIHAQPPEEFYRSHSHVIIENNGDTDALRIAVESFLSTLPTP